jgi:hypothetical protein
MPDRHRDDIRPIPNQAWHAETGVHREARELWTLGYTKYGWVCIDENCRAEMIPVAWERPNKEGHFCDEDGTRFKKCPYFRAKSTHKPSCEASYLTDPRERPSPEYYIGPPTDYPHRVNLFVTQPLRHDPDKLVTSEQDEDTERQHARWIRSIGEACEYYIGHPDEHWRPLRVDHCPGTKYRECFVRLGTGDQGVGQNWIFYDEIRLQNCVKVEDEPIRLTLLGSIYQNPRTLVIRTNTWPTEHQKNFREKLKVALAAGWEAYNEGRAERSWIFAFAKERTFDELEVEATLQPGVEVLVCVMPQLQWQYRPSHLGEEPMQAEEGKAPFVGLVADHWTDEAQNLVLAEGNSSRSVVPEAVKPLTFVKKLWRRIGKLNPWRVRPKP